eukprot:630003-Pyramimonas_sp.AAC.1
MESPWVKFGESDENHPRVVRAPWGTYNTHPTRAPGSHLDQPGPRPQGAEQKKQKALPAAASSSRPSAEGGAAAAAEAASASAGGPGAAGAGPDAAGAGAAGAAGGPTGGEKGKRGGRGGAREKTAIDMLMGKLRMLKSKYDGVTSQAHSVMNSVQVDPDWRWCSRTNGDAQLKACMDTLSAKIAADINVSRALTLKLQSFKQQMSSDAALEVALKNALGLEKEIDDVDEETKTLFAFHEVKMKALKAKADAAGGASEKKPTTKKRKAA